VRQLAVSLSLVDGFNLGGRLLRDIASFVDEQAKEYIKSLQDLRRSLHNHASVSTAVMIYRVFGKVEAIGRSMSPSCSC